MSALALLILAALPLSAEDVNPKPGPAAVEQAFLERQAGACRGALSMEALLETGPGAGSWLQALETAAPAVESYFACAGLAGRPDSCASLKGRKAGLAESASTCRERQAVARILWTAARGGDAAKPCVEMLGMLAGSPIAPEKRAEYCAVYLGAARGGSTQETCAQLDRKGLMSGKETQECPAALAYLDGRPEACSALTGARVREECAEYAALVAAARSGDAGACRASALCAAMTAKSAAECGVYKDRAAKLYCAGIGRALAAHQGRQQALREGAAALTADRLKKKAAEDSVRERRDAEAAAEAARRPVRLREEQIKFEAEDGFRKKQAAEKRAAEELAAAEKRKAREAAEKSQYKKNQPMKGHPDEVLRRMKEIEEAGRRAK